MSSSSISVGDVRRAPPPVRPFDGIIAFLSAFRAATALAADFERLNALSDRALAREGLTRADLPRVLMKRHFG